jgi:hypothetical protein
MLRGTAGAIVVATFVTVSAFGATAIRGRNAAHKADSSTSPSANAATPAPIVASARPSHSHQPRTGCRPAATSTVVVPSVVPIIPAGESMLADGVAASRSDGIVTVSFDKSMIRTRIPDKFERFLRATLPAIYGARIDSSLTRLPIGALARQGDLITVLPASGVRIPIDASWELRVFPETRPGVEGPLVVRYRATVCSAGQSECAVR